SKALQMAEPTIPLCPAMYILDVGDNIVFGFLIAIPDHGHLCLYPYISALSSPKVRVLPVYFNKSGFSFSNLSYTFFTSWAWFLFNTKMASAVSTKTTSSKPINSTCFLDPKARFVPELAPSFRNMYSYSASKEPMSDHSKEAGTTFILSERSITA